MDRKPAIPIIGGQDTRRVRIDTRTGEREQVYEEIYSEYDLGRIREGYCCIHCGEAQEKPFPERCWVCHFPMRNEQTRRFGEEFDGPTTIGPSRSLAEIRAEDEEAKARARYEREKPTSQIWLPSR